MSDSLWMRADAIVREISVAVTCNDPTDADVDRRRLEALALIVRDLAEQQGLAKETSADPIEVGAEYDLVIKVKATITSVDENTVEIALENRNYFSGRTVCIDLDEIVQSSRR